MVETVLCRWGGKSPSGWMPGTGTAFDYVPSYYTVKERPSAMDELLEASQAIVAGEAESPRCRFSRWANDNKIPILLGIAAVSLWLGGTDGGSKGRK